jgi:hypothetical protein
MSGPAEVVPKALPMNSAAAPGIIPDPSLLPGSKPLQVVLSFDQLAQFAPEGAIKYEAAMWGLGVKPEVSFEANTKTVLDAVSGWPIGEEYTRLIEAQPKLASLLKRKTSKDYEASKPRLQLLIEAADDPGVSMADVTGRFLDFFAVSHFPHWTWYSTP